MCSQLAQEVVNAGLRASLHRSDNADVKPSGAFFAHSLRFTSRPWCPRVSNGSHCWQQPLTVKFLLGVVSKICALHGRPPFRIAAGMYLARDRRFVCLELELRAFAAELRRERHWHEWSHSQCDGPAICRTQDEATTLTRRTGTTLSACPESGHQGLEGFWILIPLKLSITSTSVSLVSTVRQDDYAGRGE